MNRKGAEDTQDLPCVHELQNGKRCNQPRNHPWHDTSKYTEYGRHPYEAPNVEQPKATFEEPPCGDKNHALPCIRCERDTLEVFTAKLHNENMLLVRENKAQAEEIERLRAFRESVESALRVRNNPPDDNTMEASGLNAQFVGRISRLLA